MKKYNNRKCFINGIAFDSKKEAMRYIELLTLEKAGQITNLQRQCEFELIPAQYETFERYGKTGNRLKDGRKCVEKAVKYIADFVYVENGKTIVEDVKGYRNPQSAGYAKFVLKRKMMLYFQGIKIKEV